MEVDQVDLTAVLQANAQLTLDDLSRTFSTRSSLLQRNLSEPDAFSDLTQPVTASENSWFSGQSDSPGFEFIPDITEQNDLSDWLQSTPTQYPPVTQSSPNNIQIVAQPKASQRPCYLSDLADGKCPRYIRANQCKRNGITYKYPSVELSSNYLIRNQNYYIRVRLSTVELENGVRYVHPYSLQIPNSKTRPNIICCDRSVFYPITENDIDSNGIMTFDNLMVIKTVQERLKEYGDLFSFEANQVCLNTRRSPRRMITDYQLKKSQLGFSVVRFVPDQNSYRCFETIFSTVMTEIKEEHSEEAQHLGKWTRLFEDEFTKDGGVDLNKWTFEEGTGDKGWGTNEKQYYTRNVDRNARCEKSHLTIEARKETFKGSQYTSARLKSKQAFLYGRLQIRAKMPSAQGTWSSLFLLPGSQSYGNSMWPENGEIYLAAHFGHNPSQIRSSVTTKANNPLLNNLPRYEIEVADATTQFQVYTLLWEQDQVEMFVGPDEANALKRRIFIWEKLDKDWQGWPFDKPFHLIMNLAVGGDVAGNQIDDAKFPQQMEIDWVHFDRKT